MKLLHTTALSAFAALTVMAGAAQAKDANSAIDNLPKEGNVTLSGTVDSVTDTDTFTLKDAAGETIKVDTSSPVSLSAGDRVTIHGTKDNGVLGMGEKISAAQVSKVSPGDTSSSESSKGSYETSSNTGMNSGQTKDGALIDHLPESGPVTLMGTVDSVDDSHSFTLKDASGDTIDVKSQNSMNVSLKEGDHVKVSGQMQDEAAGMGQEIAADKVMVISADGRTSDNRAYSN